MKVLKYSLRPFTLNIEYVGLTFPVSIFKRKGFLYCQRYLNMQEFILRNKYHNIIFNRTGLWHPMAKREIWAVFLIESSRVEAFILVTLRSPGRRPSSYRWNCSTEINTNMYIMQIYLLDISNLFFWGFFFVVGVGLTSLAQLVQAQCL